MTDDRMHQGRTPLPLVHFFEQVARLKELKRRGWLRRGIPEDKTESVAAHAYGVALLALLLAREYAPVLDLAKVLSLALVHDLAEATVGDIIPADGISSAEKTRLEEQSIGQLFADFPDGGQLSELWREYETGGSAEACFVRQIDKLEMAFQAHVYRDAGWAGMEEFFVSAANVITDPDLVDVLTQLQSGRNPTGRKKAD